MGQAVEIKRMKVLKGIFGTTQYTPQQVASLKWVELASVPNCGAGTITEIRRWLSYVAGLDISDVPSFVDSELKADKDLLYAMAKLHQRGFKFIFPKEVDEVSKP